jgi:hypothetical protein
MNQDRIRAKIDDVREQIKLLEGTEGAGEITGAVGVPLEAAQAVEFQHRRILMLDNLLEMTDAEALETAQATLAQWCKTRDPILRVHVSIIAFAFEVEFETLMAMIERPA